MIPMLFQDIGEKERTRRAEELLSSMGLAERLNHRPSEMSGGEQQRVAIARSLANQPDVIVADEPTGNLDSATGKVIMEILIDLHKKEKKTIIVVTHDPTIADYGEETVHIKDGMILKNHQHKEEVVWEEKK
jgi:putative ABC transport system ATP-binding protein